MFINLNLGNAFREGLGGVLEICLWYFGRFSGSTNKGKIKEKTRKQKSKILKIFEKSKNFPVAPGRPLGYPGRPTGKFSKIFGFFENFGFFSRIFLDFFDGFLMDF